jgi:hypothetical protein
MVDVLVAMYDVIFFNTPITCKHCGALAKIIEIKDLSQIASYFTVGDILPNHTNTGVIEGTVLCFEDHNHLKEDHGFRYQEPDQKVFVAVWQHVFIGIYDSYNAAEKSLTHFGMGELFLLFNKVIDDRDDLFVWIKKIESFLRFYYYFTKLPDSEKQSIMDGKPVDTIDNQWRYYWSYLKQPNPVEAFLASSEAPRLKNPP